MRNGKTGGNVFDDLYVISGFEIHKVRDQSGNHNLERRRKPEYKSYGITWRRRCAYLTDGPMRMFTYHNEFGRKGNLQPFGHFRILSDENPGQEKNSDTDEGEHQGGDVSGM